jgi:DNA repair protein RadC
MWLRYQSAETPKVTGKTDESTPVTNRTALRTRMLDQGPESLDDAELLALMLHSGSVPADSLEALRHLVHKVGGLHGIERASISELKAMKGIGDSKAARIKAGLELGRRFAQHPLRPGDALTGSADVWRAFGARYRHIPQEHFIALMLDSKNRVIETAIISKGTLTSSPAHPREVFKQAVRNSASGIILLHNHPSGDPTPSPDDRALTQRLAEAGVILGIRVLDHIILGGEAYFSFKDAGLL